LGLWDRCLTCLLVLPGRGRCHSEDVPDDADSGVHWKLYMSTLSYGHHHYLCLMLQVSTVESKQSKHTGPVNCPELWLL